MNAVGKSRMDGPSVDLGLDLADGSAIHPTKNAIDQGDC